MEPEHNLIHLTDQQLASFLDPATSPVDLEPIARHLDDCARCEARLEEMEPALGQIREGFHRLDLRLPPAGKPRLADLERRMTRWESDQAGRRLRPRFRAPIAAAIAATVLIGLLILPWGGPELRAEMLLERAVAASAGAPQRPRLLRIETRSTSFVRRASEASDGNEAARIRQWFADANYDWQDPLSAQAYSQWWHGLEDKSSTVTGEAGEQTIRTTTTDGVLQDASLTLDEFLAPVRCRFLFADAEWVEITIAPEPGPVEPTPAAPRAAAPALPPPAADNALVVSPPFPPLKERELDVYLAMDAANVGAGTPIEMRVDAEGVIVVTGYALSRGAERTLRSSLEGIEGVDVRIVPGRPEPPNPSDRVDAILRLSQDTSFEAAFLLDLEDRFADAPLPGGKQTDLRSLRRRHATKLLNAVRALRVALEVDHDGFAPATPSPTASPRARAVVDRAASVNRLVTALYADQIEGAEAWSELESAFARLQGAASAYAQALGPVKQEVKQ